MKSSVFSRIYSPSVKTENPFPLKNGEFEINENGESVFVEKEPVAPSLASDFDVINNSMYRGVSGPVLSRECVDPVDLPGRHPELFNQ